MRSCLHAAGKLACHLARLAYAATLVGFGAATSNAAVLTYYASRAAFDAAEPGLPVEDFQPINDPGLVGSPLSSMRNNADFPAGNILPGITFKTPSGDLYVFDGALSTFTFQQTLILRFSPGVTAVGLDWFGSTGSPGGGKAGIFTARMFNGATRLGAHNLSEPANTLGFFGVSSTTDITKIDITFNATCSPQPCDAGDANPFIDNIAFGGAVAFNRYGEPFSPGSVPEPSSFLLFLCACAGLGLAGRARGARLLRFAEHVGTGGM